MSSSGVPLSRRQDWAIAIVAAVIGVGGTVLAGFLFQSGDDEGSPELTITAPDTDGGTPEVPGEVRLEGTVTDLGPGQTVWAFDSHVGSSDIYPHAGPCPVNNEGEWACTGFGIGEPRDVGSEFLVYVAVVDDADIEDIADRIADAEQGEARPLSGPRPPGVTYQSITVEKVTP